MFSASLSEFLQVIPTKSVAPDVTSCALSNGVNGINCLSIKTNGVLAEHVFLRAVFERILLTGTVKAMSKNEVFLAPLGFQFIFFV